MIRKLKIATLILIPTAYFFFICFFYLYSYYENIISHPYTELQYTYQHGLSGSIEYVDMYLIAIILLSTLISIFLFSLFKCKGIRERFSFYFIAQIAIHSSLIITAIYDYNVITKFIDWNIRPAVACNWKFYMCNIVYSVILFGILFGIDIIIYKTKNKQELSLR